METDIESDVSILVSPDDEIDILDLPIRAHNALRRHGNVCTVADLIRLVDLGQLPDIRNIGSKSALQIEHILSRVRFLEPIEIREDVSQNQSARLIAENEALRIDNAHLRRLLKQLIAIQADTTRKQLAAGLLHREAIVLGKTIDDWLAMVNSAEIESASMVLSVILESSINICDELKYIHGQGLTRNIKIFLLRYGGNAQTLDEIGKKVNLTRERVRQLCMKLAQQVEDKMLGFRSVQMTSGMLTSALSVQLPLVRIQSALLRAKDMGLDISFVAWKEEILSSGLVGRCESPPLDEFDPIELMLATCNASVDNNRIGMNIPENLSYAVQAGLDGEPDLPARVFHIRATLSPTIRKLVDRNTKYTGAVNARWLAEELRTTLVYSQDILRAIGFRSHAGEWFVPLTCDSGYTIDTHDVFHRALRKMSQYCGPLSVECICGGLRNAASRTSFPVPPPEVTAYLLDLYGYQSSNNQFFWDKPVSERLSEGELIILNCLTQYGPVVHHAELASEFVRSPLSFPTLHKTLGHSPIFEKIETGLYKLRGAVVTLEQVQRARSAAEIVPLNLSVGYDRKGYIIVCATLGALAIGNGTLVSDQLPNLAGSWTCQVNEQQAGTLEATPNEFRHLRQILAVLNCQIGDRLRFAFNVWTRTVEVQKVDR